MNTHPRIIVALDFPSAVQAHALVERLDSRKCRLKVGKELFTREGPRFVEALVEKGFDVFLDLKFHDIPNTVAAACDAAADLGVWMMNLHALGGRRMMASARERLERKSHRPRLIAVTILTSLGKDDLHEIGLVATPQEQVVRLARLAWETGLDGVVCSPLEARSIRQRLGADFTLVTPGVRPQGAQTHDQKRIMTPLEAVDAGASYLVIGRPITQAPDPLAALEAIETSLKTANED